MPGVLVSRSRNRRKPAAAVEVQESASLDDLRVAIDNFELAERRFTEAERLQFQESIADLEMRLIDPGWQRYTTLTAQEFSDEGLRRMRDICRTISLANPLIVRGLSLRSAYVHGAGYQITARANGDKGGEQDVQSVIAGFLKDKGNRRAYSGPAARDRLEKTLGTDGEFFVCLFTRPTNGAVSARIVLTDEITKIITNPEDRSEPWFYKREWDELHQGADGTETTIRQVRLYPAVDHKPSRRARRFAGLPIAGDAPMVHVAVNRPEHSQHGIPDVYAAIAWAKAYKTYLEQWAALMSALSRFAWRASSKTPAQAAALKARTSRVPLDPTTGEGAVGGFASLPDGTTLEPISKSGATIDAESGRPLAMMVAAALGVPVTMLLGDPGLTGSRATAETLDTPTELVMGQRRGTWTDADQQIIEHVIAAAVKAPKGPLKGKVEVDRWSETETVVLSGDTDLTVDYDWPDLDETTAKEAVDAIVSAHGTGVVPSEQILRLLLSALGLKDPESIVAAVMEKQEADAAAAAAPGGDSAAVTPADTSGASDASQRALPAGTQSAPAETPAAGGLAAQVLGHAEAGNWSKLNSDMDALKAAERDAPAAPDLPAHWADESAVDEDWRAEAAVARGADIAQAYGSQRDGDAVLRGFDLAAADAQLTGAAAPSLDEFKKAAKAAGQFSPTVQLDNRRVAVAMRLGVHAATRGEPATACPFSGGEPERAALRRVWLLGYLRVRPADAPAATEPAVAEVKPVAPEADAEPEGQPLAEAARTDLGALAEADLDWGLHGQARDEDQADTPEATPEASPEVKAEPDDDDIDLTKFTFPGDD